MRNNLIVTVDASNRTDGPPPGIEHAYDVIYERVIRQLTDAESLDNKLGVAIAALIALVGAVYLAQGPQVIEGVISALVLAAMVQAVRGFTYDDKFTDGVKSKFLEDRFALRAPEIKWHSFEVLKAAEKANRMRLDRKGLLLSQVALTVAVIAGVVLVGKVVS
jgi:hypothetical protein